MKKFLITTASAILVLLLNKLFDMKEYIVLVVMIAAISLTAIIISLLDLNKKLNTTNNDLLKKIDDTNTQLDAVRTQLDSVRTQLDAVRTQLDNKVDKPKILTAEEIANSMS